ncbi:MAG: LptE family protein [Verrucomicrobiae bacterium]|nr:LptE family protein [Verrucomicrobiae bacterium]
MIARISSLLAALLLLSGCASYKLGTVRDPGFKTIFIENFKSLVDEPGLENLVTTTIIQQFQADGTLTVTDEARADVVLRGKITEFTSTPVRYSRSNEITPIESSLTLGVAYTLTRRGETKPYLEGSAAGSAGFFIGSDFQSDKRQGVPIAAAKAGRQIVSQLVEGW